MHGARRREPVQLTEVIRMEHLTLEQAVDILLQKTEKIEDTEEVSLLDARGRVLAEDIAAVRNQPPFPRSPLDGYAVRSEDIRGACDGHPAVLSVVDEVTAGHVSGRTVESGTAVRIMTGAPIPEGADCIVAQEDTNYGDDRVEIYEEVRAWQNYCFEGEDYKAGSRLLEKGTFLGAIEVGILASLGLTSVLVYRRPKAALITTGDEIVLPGEALAGGKIYDSNLYTLAAQLSSWNIESTCRRRAGDDAGQVAEMIEEASSRADIIITTGGVSVGKKDIMHDVIRLLGCRRLFWKVAIKPGMPTLCAQYKGKLLICLSGNPYGAAANMELLVRPVLAKLAGRPDLEVKRKQAISDSAFPKRSNVTRYVRAYYEDGHVRASSGSNASGILSTMCGCNCFIEIPAGTEALKVGETVNVVLLYQNCF